MSYKGIRGTGRKQSPEYIAWARMKSRCQNSNNNDYYNYGGRGISVCERWESFDNFFTDMGRKPSSDFTLDRKNSDGNYCPENCHWLHTSLQSRNRRCVQRVVFQGKEMTLVEAVELTDLDYGTVDSRIRRGWGAEKALTTPVKSSPKQPKLFDYKGDRLSLSQLAKKNNVSSGNLYYFVNKLGLTVEEALAR